MATTAFGKYELHARAGQGRLTVTHRARVAGTQRDLALRQLLPHLGNDPGFLQRFADDARGAAALPPHANLVQVLDHGHVGPTHFFTTEWVHGQTLHALLDRARKKGVPFLPTPVALQIGISLCEGLHHLHGLKAADNRALKLVHREVSTDAVLLGYDGQVKLTDFLLGPSRAATKSEMGVLKGKFPCFSPEQARGEADLDRRSDVFAVGAVLYHLMCGRRPFEGELIDALPKMLKADYPAPSALNQQIPADVEVTLARALAPTREGRFASANELEAALKGSMDLTFTPDRMGRFVEWLFALERAGEGKPLTPDPAFEAWLKTWLVDLAPSTIRVASLAELQASVSASAKTVPIPAMQEEEPVAPVRANPTAVTDAVLRPVFTPTDPAAAVAERTPPMPAPSVGRVDTAQTAFALPPVKRRRGVVLVLAAVSVALVVLCGVALAVDARGNAVPPGADLAVTSTPAGATVFVDGVEQPSPTPFTLMDVSIDRPHTVIIDLPGHVRWKSKVSLLPGPNKVEAVLQPAPQ